MDCHDYIDQNGDLRVAYCEGNGAPSMPPQYTYIGYRRAGVNDYVGTARWGRSWSEVQENTGLGPMDKPPTVNG